MKACRVSLYPPFVSAIGKVIKTEDKIFSFWESLLIHLVCPHQALVLLGYNSSALGTGQHPPATLMSIFCSLMISYFTGFLAFLLLPFKGLIAQFLNFSVHHSLPEFVKQALVDFQLRVCDSVGLWWDLRFSFLVSSNLILLWLVNILTGGFYKFRIYWTDSGENYWVV